MSAPLPPDPNGERSLGDVLAAHLQAVERGENPDRAALLAAYPRLAEKQLTTAADVYSLGAILYELLTGRPPFRAGTVFDTVMQVVEKEPESPRALNPQADRDLSAIALKCLQKAPGDRYESAAALADDLDRWLAGEPTRARPPSLLGLTWRWLRRNTAAAVTVAALGLAWGGSVGMALVASDPNFPPLAMLAASPVAFNPLGWACRIVQVPAARYATWAAALALTLAFGWLLRAGVKPRSSRAALGFAAAAGLLATLIGFLFLGPMLASSPGIELHHVQDHIDPVARALPDGTMEVVHPDRDYLARFLPPDKQELNYPGAERDLDRMLFYAQIANRLNTAVTGIWGGLLIAVVFFLGLGLASAWAADAPARSGRRLPARLFCYAELYLLTAALVAVALYVSGVWMATGMQYFIGTPWAGFLGELAVTAGAAATAYAGVARRWHPLLRLALYAGWAALFIAVGLLGFR